VPTRVGRGYAGAMLETSDADALQHDVRNVARALYWQGWRLASIADHLKLKRSTVGAWKRRGAWDKASACERIEASLETRLMVLIAKSDKDGRDFKEIDLLGRQVERLARVRKYGETGKEADLNPAIEARNSGPKRNSSRNAISEEQHEQILTAFRESLFDYQKVWYRNGDQRTRNILKSRQIGATWYFAREALVDALETGRNQIFLSASKAQAHVFKQYIAQFAIDAAEVELTGDPIILPNAATLYFLGTNARTAQSYHGNFYFDEYFWVPRFRELNKVASGMAMHKRWRKTYFSTPSSITHEAYAFWTGAHANRGRAKDEHITIDVSHATLCRGHLGADAQWRQLVTVMDAVAGGCNLFDLTFGNGYLEKKKNMLGGTLSLEPALAKYVRRKTDFSGYVFVNGWEQVHEFEAGSIFHLMRPDINQEVYGLPEYLSSLHAAWLNESSTLFRRKYYENGSHAGFILYMSDAAQSQTDIDNVRDALKRSKGPGNFRNLFMYAPGGKKDGIQLIPVSEVAAKDEFFNIKNVTRDDLLAAHRVPPQLLGIVPSNTGGFGAADTAAQVFGRNEIEPMQTRFTELNDWLGEGVVTFDEYQIGPAPMPG